jgi:hypothetical protein
VSGLNTTGINVKYRNRGHSLAGGCLVAIDHIDLLGGTISGIAVDVDVKESSATYIPVKFRNYTGSGGSETSNASTNYTQDIHLSGSCDANALSCTTTTGISYAAERVLHFKNGYNFLFDTEILTAFQLNQLARDQTTLTWPSSGTQPALGNGTLTYDIDITNGIVLLTIHLTMGSTTTYGTGSYYFTGYLPAYPPTAAAVGTWFGTNAGVKWYTGAAYLSEGGGNIGIYVNDNSNGVGPTIPFTWGTDDYLHLSIAFPIS